MSGSTDATAPFDVAPVTLEGRFVRLEPLTVRHAPDPRDRALISALRSLPALRLHGSSP